MGKAPARKRLGVAVHYADAQVAHSGHQRHRQRAELIAHPWQRVDARAQADEDAVRPFHRPLVDRAGIGTAAPRTHVVGACNLGLHIAAQWTLPGHPPAYFGKAFRCRIEPVKVAVEDYDDPPGFAARQPFDRIERA